MQKISAVVSARKIKDKARRMLLTPTYHVMEMYNVHQNALIIPLTVSGNDYILVEKTLKAISASASKDHFHVVHISLVNIDAHEEQDITIDLVDITPGTVKGRIIHSDKMGDHNSFENPREEKPDIFNGAIWKGIRFL